MKIIVSHDIDHMRVWEHLGKDLILPKFIIRAHIELLKGKISLSEFINRLGDFFKNKWQCIDEVMDFNQGREIKSTFFIGVNNGLGLSYDLNQVEKWVPIIQNRGFEVGVHGISFDNYDEIKKEYDIFKRISQQNQFGIRMHYLRNNEKTIDFLEKANYLYDSTPQGFLNPYKFKNMWIFPLQIMDGWELNGDKRFQSRSFQEAKLETLSKIERAKKEKLTHLSILFHDRYMSSSFVSWKKWYMWLIDYLKDEGHQFVTHKEAIQEFEG